MSSWVQASYFVDIHPRKREGAYLAEKHLLLAWTASPQNPPCQSHCSPSIHSILFLKHLCHHLTCTGVASNTCSHTCGPSDHLCNARVCITWYETLVHHPTRMHAWDNSCVPLPSVSIPPLRAACATFAHVSLSGGASSLRRGLPTKGRTHEYHACILQCRMLLLREAVLSTVAGGDTPDGDDVSGGFLWCITPSGASPGMACTSYITLLMHLTVFPYHFSMLDMNSPIPSVTTTRVGAHWWCSMP